MKRLSRGLLLAIALLLVGWTARHLELIESTPQEGSDGRPRRWGAAAERAA